MLRLANRKATGLYPERITRYKYLDMEDVVAQVMVKPGVALSEAP